MVIRLLYYYFIPMGKIQIENRNWHIIYEIDNWGQYEIDFMDWWLAVAETLQEARKISDEYKQIDIDRENESMLDMVTEDDLY